MSEKKVILILGQRGSGKSYLAKLMLAEYNRYLIYDTLGEYIKGVSFLTLQELKDFWGKTYQGNFRLIYQPVNPIEDFDEVCDLVYSLGDMMFLVEEIDTFCSAQTLSTAFANIIQRGRHKDITLIGVSQRPYGIHRLVTSQAKEIHSFLHREPRDVDYLKSFIGEEAEKVRDLSRYHYLLWQGGKGISIRKGLNGKAIIGEKNINSKEINKKKFLKSP